MSPISDRMDLDIEWILVSYTYVALGCPKSKSEYEVLGPCAVSAEQMLAASCLFEDVLRYGSLRALGKSAP